MKFQKNNKLICIDDTGYSGRFLEKGKIYTMTGRNDHNNIILKNISGLPYEDYGFLDERFELYSINWFKKLFRQSKMNKKRSNMKEFVEKEFDIKLLDINGERSKELFGDRIGVRGKLFFDFSFNRDVEEYVAYFLGLRTSVVKDVKQEDNKLIVTTKNIVYTFELMDKE